MAPSRSYRRSPPSCRCTHTCASALCHSEAAFCPRSRYKIVSRPNPCLARTARRFAPEPDYIAGHVAACCYHVLALYCCPYCDTTTAPSHDTIFVSRHSLGVARCRMPCALPHTLRAGWLYRRLYRSLIRPCRGLSWPYRG